MQASSKYLDRFNDIQNPKRKTYAAMVSAMDDGVGAVLKQLKDKGLEENTIVISCCRWPRRKINWVKYLAYIGFNYLDLASITNMYF